MKIGLLISIFILAVVYIIISKYIKNKQQQEENLIFEEMGNIDMEIQLAEARGEDTTELLVEMQKLINRVKENNNEHKNL